MTNSEVRFGTNQSEFIPSNIDIEEAVLGVVLFSPQAITRICDRLPPEAFLLDCHRIIYQSCIALNKRGKTCDTMSVHEHLKTSGKLNAIGGRLKLAQLVSSTVGNGPIEEYADLLISKHIRRQIIRLGQEITEIGYESQNDCPDILSHIEERVARITKSPLTKPKEEFEMHQYENLTNRIQEIERKSLDPGFRLFRLQNLSKETKIPIRGLEDIYYKSLVAGENSQMTDWAALNRLFSKDSREWLMSGLLPKGKVVLLHAKGGVGKTRLAYELVYRLGKGESWGEFPVNGRYKVLIVQTDESPNDMLRVLHDRGFDAGMDIRFKTAWTVDHLQSLLGDMEGWEPDFVLIDSLSSVSKNSLFSENDVEYSRPILKLKDMAQQTGATIMLIHHSSAAGTARGSTAIFNSVSEVWKLEPDNSQSMDGLERLLKIEKTRSRAPATYRLRFNPEDKSWTCIGKEADEVNIAGVNIKERIVAFLNRNRGNVYENEEIRHEIGGVIDSVRRASFQLAEDGIIYRKDSLSTKGHPVKYYLPVYNSNHSSSKPTPKDQRYLPDLPDFSDRPLQDDLRSMIGGYDRQKSSQRQEFQELVVDDRQNNFQNSQKFQEKEFENGDPDQSNAENAVLQGLDSDHCPPIILVDHSDHHTDHSDHQEKSEILASENYSISSVSESASKKPSYLIAVESLLGNWSIRLTQDRTFKNGSKSRVALEFRNPDGDLQKKTKVRVDNRHKAEEFARNEVRLLSEDLVLRQELDCRVLQMAGVELDPHINWVDGCKLIEIPAPPLNDWYTFRSPSGDLIRVAGRDEFQLEN